MFGLCPLIKSNVQYSQDYCFSLSKTCGTVRKTEDHIYCIVTATSRVAPPAAPPDEKGMRIKTLDSKCTSGIKLSIPNFSNFSTS